MNDDRVNGQIIKIGRNWQKCEFFFVKYAWKYAICYWLMKLICIRHLLAIKYLSKLNH